MLHFKLIHPNRHQFMKNNIFCSSNELDDMPNKDVYDYLNDF